MELINNRKTYIPYLSSLLGITYEQYYFNYDVNLPQIIEFIRALFDILQISERASRLIETRDVKHEVKLSFRSLDTLLNVYENTIDTEYPQFGKLLKKISDKDITVYYRSDRIPQYVWIFKYDLIDDVKDIGISINYLMQTNELRIITSATYHTTLYDGEYGYNRIVRQPIKVYREFIVELDKLDQNNNINSDKIAKNITYHIVNMFFEPLIFLPPNYTNKSEQMIHIPNKPIKYCMKLFYSRDINNKPVYSKNKKDLILTEYINSLLKFNELSTRLEYESNKEAFDKIKDKINDVLKLLMFNSCHFSIVDITNLYMYSK